MQLSNQATLSIEVNETPCGMVTVTVNGHDYANFQNATIADIDTEKLVEWIENTYYETDMTSSAYIVPDLHLHEFANYSFPDDEDFNADSHLAIIADHIF